jgi:hypothetical protein
VLMRLTVEPVERTPATGRFDNSPTVMYFYFDTDSRWKKIISLSDTPEAFGF